MRELETLGTREAQLAVNAIINELNARNLTAVIAVADNHGELLSLSRLDGAPLASIVIAGNKAWTAARERKTTREIGQAVRDPLTSFDIAYYGDSRYIGWAGGVPVILKGSTIGAVAVSGMTEDLDEEMAKIGAAAILQLLSGMN